jgi:hypothetical protein
MISSLCLRWTAQWEMFAFTALKQDAHRGGLVLGARI